MKKKKVPRHRFLFSTEEECLTALPDDPDDTCAAIERFLAIGRGLAPNLPGPSGYFNGYGRVYPDQGHIELAGIEFDDPYRMPQIIERQHMLVAEALDRMAGEGLNFLLANNNHSGLLCEDCPVWGAHENYLTERHPSEFTELILPFLVTRIYAGAGGIHFPTGDFLAGVRPTCMTEITGGQTTSHRAIHSTAREEHHVGSTPGLYRYHQILGDGHRSHFNLALQFGATALALKSVVYDDQLPGRLSRVRGIPPARYDWLGLLRRLNVLATAGRPLKIDRLIIQTQRIYLDSARRFVDSIEEVPPWVPRVLDDWNATLDALTRLDREWLAARLDTFAKYEFYSNFLSEAGQSWLDVPGNLELFNRLALLDHSYHEFANPTSVFRQLEEAGVLTHRVGPVLLPGAEPEPFVPEVSTRAQARARFIRDHHKQTNLVLDWSCVHDFEYDRWRELTDPFATSFGPWQHEGRRPARGRALLASRRRALLRDLGD